jgi:hypothetical protein
MDLNESKRKEERRARIAAAKAQREADGVNRFENTVRVAQPNLLSHLGSSEQYPINYIPIIPINGPLRPELVENGSYRGRLPLETELRLRIESTPIEEIIEANRATRSASSANRWGETGSKLLARKSANGMPYETYAQSILDQTKTLANNGRYTVAQSPFSSRTAESAKQRANAGHNRLLARNGGRRTQRRITRRRLTRKSKK